VSNIRNITDNERALLEALQDIVMETMEYPARRPLDSASYLPCELVDKAQQALAGYGLQLFDNRPAPRLAA